MIKAIIGFVFGYAFAMLFVGIYYGLDWDLSVIINIVIALATCIGAFIAGFTVYGNEKDRKWDIQEKSFLELTTNLHDVISIDNEINDVFTKISNLDDLINKGEITSDKHFEEEQKLIGQQEFLLSKSRPRYRKLNQKITSFLNVHRPLIPDNIINAIETHQSNSKLYDEDYKSGKFDESRYYTLRSKSLNGLHEELLQYIKKTARIK